MTHISRRAIGMGLLAVLCVAACGVDGGSGPPPPTVYKDYVLVASSLSNKVIVFSLDRVSGELTEVGGATFTAGFDPRSLAIGPGGKFVYVVGGGNTSIRAYSINAATGALTPFGSNYWAGGRPRTIAVGPSRKFAYVVCSEDEYISAFSINPDTGALRMTSGSPFAATGGTIVFEPAGRFAYVLSYGSESVSVFSVGSTTGALTPVAGPVVGVGTNPMAIAVDPSGKFVFVVNRGSDDISAFSIDAATGALTEVPGSPFPVAGSFPYYPTPETIAIEPSGRFAYVVHGTPIISQFAIDGATGALTPVRSLLTFWDSPFAIAMDPLGEYAYVVYWRPSAYITAFSINPSSGALFVEGESSAGDYAHAVVATRIAQ
jgi:6-phosphogluconolactonase (cycloisomerase 2 family)